MFIQVISQFDEVNKTEKSNKKGIEQFKTKNYGKISKYKDLNQRKLKK